jgi:hypothetical protein
MFVNGNIFQPSLVFVGEAHPIIVKHLEGSFLQIYDTSSDNDKRSSLLCHIFSNDEKSFWTFVPGLPDLGK